MLCTDSFEYGAAHPALKATPVDTRREHRDRVIWLSRPTDVQVESLPLPCLVPKEGRTVSAWLPSLSEGTVQQEPWLKKVSKKAHPFAKPARA
jgi:hypothetical protein